MPQDEKPSNKPAPTDFEGLAAQLAALRDDLTELTGSVTTLADRRGRKMAADISEGVSEAVQYVEHKSHGAEAEFEKSVAKHPFMALGLAAGIGLLIGAMTRRG